ncbi:MFS transporter [Streptomyces clavuligerus]|uniref:Efflux protein CmcT n=1 Tax=Streptomyces clavuligerus TaxID=1901 RepID=O85724_STRCL|nr:MFS transporter [Streptomyces clavuligerus]AAC32489.1 efflux protein CmcT [Streptomyces clavuligerus]ANW18120.1 multidrug transporter [Streptomyces clavuligerus]AXU12682.1 MFS transporter [Streptomyces clavuligerus]EDY47104.1 cephamycin export protein cmcT [Streptomyces clavuligerus]MBY6302584.1 MFS transporter [Streptomyces clavuligerus]
MRGSSAARTALALSCTTHFLVLFDVSVMTVALPSIQSDLGFTPSGLQWVVSAYTLAFAGLLLLGGRLADLYGHRRVFTAGLAVFTVASLLGGLATDPATLIAARAAQGLGAAVLAPLSLTMLTTSFPEGPSRTRALTIWTAVALAGGAAGNLLGGLLTEYLSWRSVLLVNVPVGIPAALFGLRVLARRGAPERAVRLDLPGAVLATAALTLLTFGVAQAHTHAWSDPRTALPLLGGGAALVAFAVVEARFAATPLIPPRLFRLPGIGWGNLAMLLAGASQVPLWYFLTLTMQDVLGYSAAQTGLGFLPHAAVMLLVSLRLIPLLMRRVQARVLIATGAIVEAGGFWWQSAITPDSGYVTGILGPAVLLSLGGGLLSTPLTRTVTSGVSHADAGAASGLMNTTRQFGGAFGLAVVLTLTATGTTGAAGSPAALAESYGDAFLSMAVILLVLAALTPLLPALRDSRSGARPGAGAGENTDGADGDTRPAVR